MEPEVFLKDVLRLAKCAKLAIVNTSLMIWVESRATFLAARKIYATGTVINQPPASLLANGLSVVFGLL